MDRPIGIAAGLIKKAAHIPEGLQEYVNHITFGSFTCEPREGNKEPTYYFDQKTGSSINAVGLKNDGIVQFAREEFPKALRVKKRECVYRVSLAPLKTGDAGHMLEHITRMSGSFFEIEINAACPNHRDGKGLHPVLAHDPVALHALMAEMSGFNVSKGIKIAPLMNEESLKTLVELTREFKFTSIVSGNTLLSSSTIDGVQRLSVPKGGMGGTILLEGGVAQVRTLRYLIDEVYGSEKKPKLIGCGGIMSARDVKQYLNAGADGGVQIATYYSEFGVRGVRDLVANLV